MRCDGLSAVGLAADFGRVPGLRAVTFDVAREECVAIVGPSGAGKTTLLRTIAGFLTATAGSVAIGGRDVTTLPPEQRGAVYLHQSPLLFPHLSVFENVAFPLRVRRIAGRELDRRVGEALAVVRTEHLARRRPDSLSGGEGRRVALARAIVARPTALLLDEPLSSVDPVLRAEVREALRGVQAAIRAAIVLVTHDFDDASSLATRIGVLLSGTLAQMAPASRLFSHPASLAVARFLGIANETPGVVGSDGTMSTPLGALDAASVRPGPAVAVFPADALTTDASSGTEGVVTELLYRPSGLIARVTAAGQLLLMAADPADPPPVGARLLLRLDPRRVRVYPAETPDVR